MSIFTSILNKIFPSAHAETSTASQSSPPVDNQRAASSSSPIATPSNPQVSETDVEKNPE